MSGYPVGYLPWQVRDLLRGRGPVAAVIVGLFVLAVWRLPSQYLGGSGISLFQGYLLLGGWPLILVATGEMVRDDRAEGYYRFYFSRPVNPAALYLVRFALGYLLVMAAALIVAGAIWQRTSVFHLRPEVIGLLTLSYGLVGGTVFLLSTAFSGGPRDWLAVLVILFYQTQISNFLGQGFDLWPTFKVLHLLLPPVHLVRLDGAMPAGNALLHAAMYGGALVTASLALLHFRPLGSGARD